MTSETVIGVDLGGTVVNVGKVERERVVKSISSNITTRGKKKQILNEIVEAVEKVFDQSIAGIGIGVPSVVDVEKGIVCNVQNIPSWKEVPLRVGKPFKRMHPI